MSTLIVLILLSLPVLVGLSLWRSGQRRARHRQDLIEAGLRPDQRQAILAAVPLIARLPEDLRPMLEGRVALFLEQVAFVGCDGLEVSEEMRLSIAAQACLIPLASDLWYEELTTVLVYPGAFRSRMVSRDGYVVREEEVVRLGESWSRGQVVLSWADVAAGAADPEDGRNVVLHEFAHQFDDLSGDTNGVPVLAEGQSFDEWERVFLRAYMRLRRRAETGRASVLDTYGAQSHEEFFAVAIEAFFERPGDLREDEPELYAQLSELLNLDPVSWR
ncbi:zinc-dependent peptidase [Roseovarius sp. CH_XMU1461]|uniref:M90 family metallopeptidase n=1 Tax=Roseovarius sp. CH_XMU1461 TaxID=3107777 RepID=UPI003008F5D5